MTKPHLIQQFGHEGIGRYRDASSLLIGKQVILNELILPRTPEIDQMQLTTRGTLAAVVSQVKVYPTQSGGWERKYGPVGSRPANTALGLNLPMGNQAVSSVLDDRGQAIAVLSRLLVQEKGAKKEPKDMSWKTFLDLLGVPKKHRKTFIDAVNNMPLDQDASPMHLQEVGGVPQWGSTLEEDDDGHADFDCVISLSPESRAALEKLLPGLI